MEKFRLNNLNYIFILSPVLFLFVYVSVLFLDSYFMFAVTTIDPSISFSSLLQTKSRWSFCLVGFWFSFLLRLRD